MRNGTTIRKESGESGLALCFTSLSLPLSYSLRVLCNWNLSESPTDAEPLKGKFCLFLLCRCWHSWCRRLHHHTIAITHFGTPRGHCTQQLSLSMNHLLPMCQCSLHTAQRNNRIKRASQMYTMITFDLLLIHLGYPVHNVDAAIHRIRRSTTKTQKRTNATFVVLSSISIRMYCLILILCY